MEIKIFSGNFSELGEQQGKIYSKNGMSFTKVKINNKILPKTTKSLQKILS